MLVTALSQKIGTLFQTAWSPAPGCDSGVARDTLYAAVLCSSPPSPPLTFSSPQFLKQMYVLVLGLDVLGNPFGLIRGLSEGVEALLLRALPG